MPKPSASTGTREHTIRISTGSGEPSAAEALRDVVDAAVAKSSAREPHLLITPEMVAARFGLNAARDAGAAVLDATRYADTVVRLDLWKHPTWAHFLKDMDSGEKLNERDHTDLTRAAVDIAHARLISLGWIAGDAKDLRDMAWGMLRRLTSR